MTDRARGALLAGALGDALGMPTQLLSPREIREIHGRVDDFVPPTADHPVSRGLAAGTITDDTEQTLLLARLLLDSRDGFDHALWVERLLDWEAGVKARGGYDLLGPSTRRAIDAVRAGTPPEEAGRHGDTNGAAMRIAPVGILMPPDPITALVARVAETCRATHNTGLAISAAAAVAAAISAGVEGASWREAADRAIEAARLGRDHGYPSTGPDIAARIGWARDLVRDLPAADALRRIVDLVGTGVAAQESVPAAFAVLDLAAGDPWMAAVHAANLGGDADTIGAIAASMAGACCGAERLPQDKLSALRGIDLAEVDALARDLVATRRRSAPRRASRGKVELPRLVHTGAAVVDYLYRIDNLPDPGTERTARSHRRQPGGGFNTMLAARRAGIAAACAGPLGTGPDGDLLRRAMTEHEIGLPLPPCTTRDSGNSVVLVTADGERSFVSWPGAEVQPVDRTPVLAALRPGDCVLITGYSLTSGAGEDLADFAEALPPEIPLLFDPAPVIADVPRGILGRILARSDWVSANRAELAILAPDAADPAGAVLAAMGPQAQGLIIRAGAEGCTLCRPGRTPLHLPAFAVRAVDTNGAGDTHIGAFAAELARGVAPEPAARFANAAAALSVTMEGGATAPTRAETEAFLNAQDPGSLSGASPAHPGTGHGGPEP